MVMINDNSGGGVNQLVGQFAANKKKTVIAVALVVLMIFMWIRLISGKGTKSARAAVRTVANTDNTDVPLKVEFVELPYVKGRHDVLTRDFFRLDGRNFNASEQVNIVSQNNTKHGVREVAERLRLDAISTGDQPEAFINDKLLKVGDILVLNEGSKFYECEIVSIEENVVLVKYGQAEIELKLKQPESAAKRFED